MVTGSPILSELNEDFFSLLAIYKIPVESFVETIDMKVTATLPKLTWVTPTSAGEFPQCFQILVCHYFGLE